MKTLIQIVLLLVLATFSTTTFAKDTYSLGSGAWGSISWDNGAPVAGDNVFISTGDIVTSGSFTANYNLTIQSGAQFVITGNLTNSATWNYTIISSGLLSVSGSMNLDNGLAVTVNDSMYVGTNLTTFQASLHIASAGRASVGGATVTNCPITVDDGGLLNVVTNFTIGTTGSPATNNHGTIRVGGNFLSTNGTFTNFSTGKMYVTGTAEFSNGSTSTNAGIIDVTGLYSVQSGVLTNTGGYIYARNGIRTFNGGCIINGNVDLWGSFTNESACPLATNVTLPVELVNFNASIEADGILLEWVSMSELNNNYYELEYSNDGKNFEKIAVLDGQGTTSVEHSYEFLDKNTSYGNRYYRIKQVDFDGKFTFSVIISIYYTPSQQILLRAYIDGGNYIIENSGLYGQTLRIINIEGKVEYTTVLTNNVLTIPASSISPGMKVIIAGNQIDIQ